MPAGFAAGAAWRVGAGWTGAVIQIAGNAVFVVTVFMAVGADRFESVTQEALVNGANAALVHKANGEPEIIQFRDTITKAGIQQIQ